MSSRDGVEIKESGHPFLHSQMLNDNLFCPPDYSYEGHSEWETQGNFHYRAN